MSFDWKLHLEKLNIEKVTGAGVESRKKKDAKYIEKSTDIFQTT